MGILEQITQMKNQGMPDEQIVRSLQEQGVSPREINDALNQAQIKSAISQNEQEPMNPPSPNPEQGNYYPQTQEIPEQEMYNTSQPQETYQQEENYGYSPETTSSDMTIEIAEQVFSEKIKKTQKQVEDLVEFKTLSEVKIENIADRLKRMENIIDKLQIEILGKIGAYGKNIEGIKKEMSMMQDSFGKVINQAVRHKPSSHKKTSKKK
ncbi:hypothetical protein KAJ87_02475 [Candidatus Pacearchaeota archaeon]|nr:hypothetical protein [Candidatus Pacearchaeota archaeon]